MNIQFISGVIMVVLTVSIVLDSIKKIRNREENRWMWILSAFCCGTGGIILSILLLTGNW